METGAIVRSCQRVDLVHTWEDGLGMGMTSRIDMVVQWGMGIR